MVDTADLAADAAEALPREATGKPPRVAGHEATGPDMGGRSSPLVKGLGTQDERLEIDDDRLVATAVAEGRVGALPRRINQSWAKVSEEYEQLAMILKDEGKALLWEFHQGGPAA